ncbi:hypothetical protein F01_490020 [Burkholderia cenocepacia]|nr:hypothetical protein F01_490020 [Burkholderia cenocepacia]
MFMARLLVSVDDVADVSGPRAAIVAGRARTVDYVRGKEIARAPPQKKTGARRRPHRLAVTTLRIRSPAPD